MEPSRDVADLLAIMAALRHPDTGCAWDIAQTFASIAPYAIEEAHEVVDAVDRGDLEDLRDELGDLLLQVVFHARMAEEKGVFDFGGVVEAITAKMVRRHPHVFDVVKVQSPAEVKALWAKIKQDEQHQRQVRRGGDAVAHLDGVPSKLPALIQAVKLQCRASIVGFDWPDIADVSRKVLEEVEELEAAIASGHRADIEDELGDLLFSVVNLSRRASVDPEAALRRSNAKFRRRFGHIERRLAEQGRALADAALEEMEGFWQEAKRLEQR